MWRIEEWSTANDVIRILEISHKQLYVQTRPALRPKFSQSLVPFLPSIMLFGKNSSHSAPDSRYRNFPGFAPSSSFVCLISERVKYKFSINVNRIDLSVEKNLLTNKVRVDFWTWTNDSWSQNYPSDESSKFTNVALSQRREQLKLGPELRLVWIQRRMNLSTKLLWRSRPSTLPIKDSAWVRGGWPWTREYKERVKSRYLTSLHEKRLILLDEEVLRCSVQTGYWK